MNLSHLILQMALIQSLILPRMILHKKNQHVFPSTVGHAKILTSTCLTNVLLILRLYKMIKLFFYDPDDHDPGWKVKNCYLFLIDVATEVENSIKNLWKRGSAAPYCWAKKEFWYLPQWDTP